MCLCASAKLGPDAGDRYTGTWLVSQTNRQDWTQFGFPAGSWIVEYGDLWKLPVLGVPMSDIYIFARAQADGPHGDYLQAKPAPPVATPWTRRGAWNDIHNYVYGDLVTYGGEYYLCEQPNTNDPPPSANWITLLKVVVTPA